ncbi:MAG TPA: TetR family transcriptional regulator [Acidimicrobiales bacterium]|nr:TetR family transcriptional regulator [Acidimicrobiales bacterium]
MAGTRSNQSQARPKTPQANITRGVRRTRALKSPFTISELAERAGVSVPTIHSYRRLGLLPEPTIVATNRYLYDDRHVEALAMIRLLRGERHMSLASIAEVLPDLLPDGREEAFRPQMWDQVLTAYLDAAARSEPLARLLAAARDAFAHHGYVGVNIADICAAADMATGSFYRHFESKDAIFLAAVQSVPEAVGDELKGLPSHIGKARAITLVRGLLEPYMPLLLEFVLRERRAASEPTGVMDSVTGELAARLQPHMRSTDRSVADTASDVVSAALVELIQGALGLHTS